MDWTRLTVSGRVTAMQRGLCAGVTDQGTVFVAQLRLPHVTATTYDDVLVDSFGVLGIAPGDGGETLLSGRGADGRLQLWGVRDDHPLVRTHALDGVAQMWAVPALDAGTDLLLSAHLDDGSWSLRADDLGVAIGGAAPTRRALAMAAGPDAALVLGSPEKEPLVVAGRLGDTGTPSAWALGDDDWRRIHLTTAPSLLTSVAYAWGGRHTWIGGVAEGRAMVSELLPFPFRGPLRSASVAIPGLELVALPEGHGRPLVLVDDVAGDLPVMLAAMSRGNRLCWHDGTEWKALPAPDGPLRAACAADGGIHVLIGQSVWSITDPTTA
ncbi:MAG: hypothetical protein QM747_21075 [Nocardioides sp.]